MASSNEDSTFDDEFLELLLKPSDQGPEIIMGETESPFFSDITSHAILEKSRSNTPLLQFLTRLLQPQLAQKPSWFKKLKLDGSQIKIFITEEAEADILGLFLDLTHRSFLHFCVYLVHDRLVEWSHLKKFFSITICPIIFTRSGVQNIMYSCLPLFEYKLIDAAHPAYTAVQYRRSSRAAMVMQEAVSNSTLNYTWTERDAQDISAFNKFLSGMFHNPVYTSHVYGVKSLTSNDMVELRGFVFNKYYAIDMGADHSAHTLQETGKTLTGMTQLGVMPSLLMAPTVPTFCHLGHHASQITSVIQQPNIQRNNVEGACHLIAPSVTLPVGITPLVMS